MKTCLNYNLSDRVELGGGGGAGGGKGYYWKEGGWPTQGVETRPTVRFQAFHPDVDLHSESKPRIKKVD